MLAAYGERPPVAHDIGRSRRLGRPERAVPWGCGPAPADRHDPRHARLLPVQGRRGPRDLRRQGGEPPLSGSATTSRTRAGLHPRTAQMVASAATVEWIQVRNEVEALMLEYSLIKQHRPRFNIRLRDDKSYPFLAVTLDEEWPRAMVMRGRKRKGVRYFGPYGHAYAIRDTLDLLLRTFPIRTCSPNKFHTARAARPSVPAVPHREVLGPVRRRGRRPSATRSWSASCSTSSTATPTTIVKRLEQRDAGGRRRSWSSSGRPACRDRLAAVQQGHRAPADGGRAQRGHRRHRHRRRRARSGRPGLLRPQGPGGRAQGLHRRQGGGP